jgi:hypothetical protein
MVGEGVEREEGEAKWIFAIRFFFAKPSRHTDNLYPYVRDGERMS